MHCTQATGKPQHQLLDVGKYNLHLPLPPLRTETASADSEQTTPLVSSAGLQLKLKASAVTLLEAACENPQSCSHRSMSSHARLILMPIFILILY